MVVKLYKNTSENNAINKRISHISDENCVIKGDISILNPRIIITFDDNFDDINYCYIADFGRYYFIDSITPMTGSRYEVVCSVDVLQTYMNEILDLECILSKQQDLDNGNSYYNDGSYTGLTQTYTEVKQWENGLPNSAEYILVCAG